MIIGLYHCLIQIIEKPFIKTVCKRKVDTIDLSNDFLVSFNLKRDIH